MKRIISVFILLILLSSCSVQENMSPHIFVGRLQKVDDSIVIDIDNMFSENGKYVCYGKYAQTADVVFQMTVNEQGSIKKISLACNQKDKADLFIECVKSVIDIYSDDGSETVKNSLFVKKKISDECIYYDTQWYSYSAVLSENGLFFSAESKKLSPQSEVEFSLKPNDIVEY